MLNPTRTRKIGVETLLACCIINSTKDRRYRHSDGSIRNILIDCGKTFYESALHSFPKHKIRKLDGVLLTHGHADAMLGLDDLRQWTFGGDGCERVQEKVDIYLSKETFGVVKSAFPYCVDPSTATGGGGVPNLEFHVLECAVDSSTPLPFFIDELEIIPFEVEHGIVKDGGPYWSLGFRIGSFVYISDCSLIPQQAKEIISNCQNLVIDALRRKLLFLNSSDTASVSLQF